MGLEITVRAEDLTRLARDLGRASDGKALKKRLSRELRIEATKLVPPLRASIMAIPSRERAPKRARPGLRALMARSVTVQVKTGKWAAVRVFMNPKKMPNGMKSLPGYFEGIPGKERLRHPVFGHRDRWVSQYPRPYFDRGTRDAEKDAAEGVQRVMEELAKEIEE